MIINKDTKIAIIGLGYVGLPLAVEFGKIFKTIGFDTNNSRIKELLESNDSTLEINTKELKKSIKLSFTMNTEDLKDTNIFIITVPTPIDSEKKPNLNPLISACKTVSNLIKKDNIVIFESTVYPGATEEVCVPILEKYSGLKFNKDFFCGYSPERINPGDKEHRITNIKKITSGSNNEIAEKVDFLYKKIILAGTFKVKSIKIAEAAKVIENTQRDINIALINELAMIFQKLEIDTEAVLKAAATKWNFLPFSPGLVGGHCIGVDPYYLTYKSIEVGHNPEMILAGRRINDSMGPYIVEQLILLMAKKQINIIGANILIMGLTFKENCPDLRNSRVLDIVNEIVKLKCNVDLYDPWADDEKVYNNFGLPPVKEPKIGKYDVILIAVAHREFKNLKINQIRSYGKLNHVLYDAKYVLGLDEVDGRL
jgi:UDP-N-acetyl-D-glucosamine/UDP-N-acetyl-D-galactosamine dehydrogenase